MTNTDILQKQLASLGIFEITSDEITHRAPQGSIWVAQCPDETSIGFDSVEGALTFQLHSRTCMVGNL